MCEARPSTGVAFLCTPTDIHVCTDAADAAARARYGSGLGSFGLEKLANLLSRGKACVKASRAHTPRTRARARENDLRFFGSQLQQI